MNEVPRYRGTIASIIGLVVAVLVSVSPAWAAKPSSAGSDTSNGGNEGTVMVVDAETGTALEGNDPHVCTFYLEFSEAPTGETGEWTVRNWPPTGDGTVVASGTYAIGISGSDTTDLMALDPGHYRLEWQGVSDANAKHKTFWVDECTPQVEATSEPTVAPSAEPIPSPTAEATVSPSTEPTASPSPSPSDAPTAEALVVPTPSQTEPEGDQAAGEGSPPPGSQAPEPAPVDPSGSPEGGESALVGGPIVDELPDTALDAPILPGLSVALGLLALAACQAAAQARRAAEDREV